MMLRAWWRRRVVGADPTRSFIAWFFRGCGAGPGYRYFERTHLLFCAAVGSIFSVLCTRRPWEVASAALLPVAGVLFAVGFALVSTTLNLLNSREIRAIGSKRPGGIADMANYYQLVITSLLTSATIWGAIAAGPYRGPAWLFGITRHGGNFVLAFTITSAFIEVWSASDFGRKLIVLSSEVTGVPESASGERDQSGPL